MNKRRLAVMISATFVVGAIAALGLFYLIHNKNASSSNSIDNTSDCMGIVVLDGFKISIPDKYAAAVYQDVGLSYFDSDTFEMGISVVEGYIDETSEGLAEMSQDIDSWFTMLKSFDKIAVDGRSYFYCVYEDEGETILLAYKEADSEHAFEIMVRCLEIDQLRFQSEDELNREYESFILIADTHNKRTIKEMFFTYSTVG